MAKVTRRRPAVRSRNVSGVSLIGIASSQAVSPLVELNSSFAWPALEARTLGRVYDFSELADDEFPTSKRLVRQFRKIVHPTPDR